MNITNTIPLAIVCSLLSLSSCQQIALDNEEKSTEEIVIPKGQSQLALQLATEANDAEISWPVSIYVFNSDNTCTDTKTLTSSTASANFILPADTYSLYAVGGMNSDNYTIPTKDNATSTSTISLMNGVNEHTDIMMAQKSDITLVADKSYTQTLDFTRKVAKITSMKITDVPTDVTEVTVIISPVYKAIKLDGTFTDIGTSSWSYKLTKDNTTKTTWNCDCNSYILPNNGEMSIKYQFKTDTQTREFTQTTSQITSNHKISLEANYKKEVLTASLTWGLNGATWDDDVNISFTVDEAKMTKVEDNTNPDDNTNYNTEPAADVVATTGKTAPEVGANLNSNGTAVYVIRKQIYGNYTYVTLMYQSEKNEISNKKLTEQQDIKTAVEKIFKETINNKETASIKQWRLPTLYELKYLYNHYDELRTIIKLESFIKKDNDYCCYYCTDSNGDIIGYTFNSDKVVDLNTNGVGSRINGFAIVKYSN